MNNFVSICGKSGRSLDSHVRVAVVDHLCEVLTFAGDWDRPHPIGRESVLHGGGWWVGKSSAIRFDVLEEEIVVSQFAIDLAGSYRYVQASDEVAQLLRSISPAIEAAGAELSIDDPTAISSL